jgi:cytochrome c peroxidase
VRAVRGLVAIAFAWLLASTLIAAAPTLDATSTYHWNIPSWAAPPMVPADNPMTEAKVALGRYLFYDKRLSGNQSQSCASCHQQRLGFSDPNATGIGSTGEKNVLRTANLTNVGYATVLTWANPLKR